MKYNKKNRIIRNSIFVVVLFNCYIYSQCDSSYTYFSDVDIPDDVSNSSNCFYDNDLSVINELITINSLSYTTPLDVGNQIWGDDDGRLVNWTLTYGPPGAASGISEKLSQLPDNIGQLSELTTLYIEKHDLTELPASFTSLSNLFNFYVSSNWLSTLPEDLGNLTSLYILDLGYNQLEYLPESIGGLINLQYLFLFNNQFSSLPETICDLNLDWDGINPYINWPYFACGGNYLCDPELIPDCVENSVNFEINMDANYYAFPIYEPQIGPELGDINGDGIWNVLDIVQLASCVLDDNCAELENLCPASEDLNGDGNYNVLDIVALANCVLDDNCGI